MLEHSGLTVSATEAQTSLWQEELRTPEVGHTPSSLRPSSLFALMTLSTPVLPVGSRPVSKALVLL